MQSKLDIKSTKTELLLSFLQENNEPEYRLKQIYYWLFAKNISDFSQMSNLSLRFRNALKDNFVITNLKEYFKSNSSDGSIRYIFKLKEGSLAESVLINNENRTTACISSQVGCSLSCKFCATGYLQYKRNLDACEIYEQAYLLNQQSIQNYSKPLSNIVYMGMGEPLLNYKNVLQSLKYLSSNDIGLGLSGKRITISTAGISKMIKNLASDAPKINLALSLHAACDEKRSQIMPINDTNTIKNLIDSLVQYCKITKNLVTIEYILFNNFNDDLQDAQKLVNICKQIPSKVNLIEYNPIDKYIDLQPSSRNRIHYFQKYLSSKNINTTIRYSKGRDINAACGQLSFKYQQ